MKKLYHFLVTSYKLRVTSYKLHTPQTSHLKPQTSYLTPLTSYLIPLFAFCFLHFSAGAQNNNVQFPVPQNFKMSLHYISLGDWGVCEGEAVVGPYHCTTFQWNEPDLSETESQLVGYNIYNYETEEELTEIPFSEGNIIVQTVEIGLEMGSGFMGYTWVTAVYSEPDGESAPSNVEFARLPLGINKNETKTHSIVYNSQMKTIEIIGVENIASINVFGIDGRLITASELNNIDVKYLTNGVYIIKVTTKTGKIISDKLIIENYR